MCRAEVRNESRALGRSSEILRRCVNGDPSATATVPARKKAATYRPVVNSMADGCRKAADAAAWMLRVEVYNAFSLFAADS
jgi:hypothetical protein